MSVPYWRYVRYTDDGCAVYQCLFCKSDWESRTCPGWFDTHERFDHPVDGGHKFMQTIKGEQVPFWTRERDEYIYKRVFNFCPFCGTWFKGPIRCNVDNEYMLGPKRLQRELLMDAFWDKLGREKRQEWGRPSWWWVIQSRDNVIWSDCDSSWVDKTWTPLVKCDPRLFNAVAVFELLVWHRNYWWGQHDMKGASAAEADALLRKVVRVVKREHKSLSRDERFVHEHYPRAGPVSVTTICGDDD